MFLSTESSLVSTKLAALYATLHSTLVSELGEAVRNDLEAINTGYFHKLVICTAVVLVGVALEEFDSLPLGRFSRSRLNLATGVFMRLYGLLAWKKKLAKLGWILIVVGVLGEGISEYLGGHIRRPCTGLR